MPARSRRRSPPGFPGGFPRGRERQTQVVAREKLPRWGKSGKILSAVTCVALFVAVLPCSSENTDKGQGLPRNLPVVLWREEKAENMSSGWQLALLRLLLSLPGLDKGLRTAGAVLRALPGGSSPHRVAPPEKSRPSPCGDESKTRAESFTRRRFEGARPAGSCLPPAWQRGSARRGRDLTCRGQ